MSGPTVSRNIIYPAREMSDPANDPGFRLMLWSDGSVTWKNEDPEREAPSGND